VHVDLFAFTPIPPSQVRRAVSLGLGGSFAWEISLDWSPPGSAHPLIDAMAAGLNAKVFD
jgi:hypothetical protein